MRLAAVRAGDGVRWGPVIEDRLHDVSGAFDSPVALLEASTTDAGRAGIERAADVAATTALHQRELLPPIPAPRRILCIGVNYREHAAESDRPPETGQHPVVFTRFPSSLVGHGSPVVRPRASTAFDYEGELALVIGRAVRSVGDDEALAAVGGYACFMDGTLRDFQRHTSQFTPGKNFDRSGAFGPWITTADEVGDPGDLALTTTHNGEVVQQARTSQLIHGLARLVAYCSSFTTLEPGDVIATGTPGGVGYARDPQRWLTPGDEVSVTIDRVGTLTNPVGDEA